jgi:hypothetical protein
MKWLWWRRPVRTAEVEAPASTSFASFLGLTGPTAQEFVRGRVAELARAGSLDAANGDVLDAWLDGLRDEWHAQHAAERTARLDAAERELGRLEADALAKKQRADAATEELDRTKRFLDAAERNILEPAEAHAGERRERRRRPRPTVDPLEGLEHRWWHGLFLKFLVLMAAVGDVVTFNVTLSAFFRDSGPLVLWGLTFALAAASVGLMHTAGHALRNLREGRGGHGRPAVAFLVFGWLVIGTVAVVFRVQVATPLGSKPSAFGADTAADAAAAAHDALLSAILLGGLFVASGLLAFYAGFAEHHPRMKTYLAVRKQLPKRQETATRLAHEAEKARQVVEHARGEADRVDQWARDAIAVADATIAELKELVRVEMSAHLGTPEATTGLIAGRQSGGAEPTTPAPSTATPVPVRPWPRVPLPLEPAGRATDLWTNTVPGAGERSQNGHGSINGHSSPNGSR